MRGHEFHRALALADSAEKRAPGLADAHFLRARIYSELGRFQESETAYLTAYKLQPDYRGILNNLGNNAFRQEKFLKSIEYYQRELEAHPAPIPLRGMGRAHVELGQVDSARRAFERAIAMDSLYAPGYFNLALLQEDEGDYEAALRNAQRALSLDSENLDYRYLVGSYLVKTGRNEKALSHLRVIVGKRPWHHGSHYNLGQALVRLGREEEGKEYLEQAEQARAQQAKVEHMENTRNSMPDDPYTHAALAFALRRAGRYNDAMHAYKVALYLQPQSVEIQNNLANLCLIRGDTTEAIINYRAILQRDPTQLDIWFNLGIVYALSGDVEQAEAAWRTVLRFSPDNQRAIAYLKKIGKQP